jgi:hypothetical protein
MEPKKVVLLWSLNVHHRVNESSPIHLLVSQLSPVCSVTRFLGGRKIAKSDY